MSSPEGGAAAARTSIPSGLLAIAIFVLSEAMFFAGLISAFIVLKVQAADWPPLGQPRLPIAVTGVNTAVLLLSGWTMHRALAAVQESRALLVRRLSITAALGALFLAIQGYEWVRLVSFGLTTSSSLYGATFYTLIGAHGLHVFAALLALLLVVSRARRGRYVADDHTGLRMCHLYWLFVVAVWPVLYVMVYLS